jgi:BirA family biotin operon repressor/biotin-[acetyl-CoA-carboxylase] ligase
MSTKNTNLFAPDFIAGLDAPVERFDRVGSTNNYAIQLIDADKAEHGLTILAGSQTEGKGQRGKNWQDTPGESLLMSLIVEPAFGITDQPLFLATSVVSVVNVLQKHIAGREVRIKWPNDIIISDKKAGGMLIENVLRGQAWAWAVIGLGLNISQIGFSEDLPYATSLVMASGHHFDRDVLALEFRREILKRLSRKDSAVWDEYNDLLYKRGKIQPFNKDGKMYNAKILEVNPSGQLGLRDFEGKMQWVNHGKLEWVW